MVKSCCAGSNPATSSNTRDRWESLLTEEKAIEIIRDLAPSKVEVKRVVVVGERPFDVEKRGEEEIIRYAKHLLECKGRRTRFVKEDPRTM